VFEHGCIGGADERFVAASGRDAVEELQVVALRVGERGERRGERGTVRI
jgi:hypothetical protein